MNEIEVAKVNEVTITLAPTALQQRDCILALARGITGIENSEGETNAVYVVSRMNGFAKALEACRKAVKAPVLDLGKRIDSIATQALSDLEKEKGRIQGMLAEIERKRQAEALAREEAARKEQERIAAEERRIAEAQRKAEQEALDRQNQLKTKAARERAAEEARVRQAEIDKQRQALESQKATIIATPAPEPEKAKGSIVREVYEVEVFDAKALYAWNPLYCKLVPELSMLKTAASRGVTQIPGCRITKQMKVSVRSSTGEVPRIASEEVPG